MPDQPPAHREEPSTPEESHHRFRAAQSPLGNFGLLLLMAVAQLLVLPVAYVTWSPLVFPLAPVPALLISFFGYRPANEVPDGSLIRDWGHALGWAYVETGMRTHWVTSDSLEGIGGTDIVEPLVLEPRLDGFTVWVPARSSGRPDAMIAYLRSTFASAVPWWVVIGTAFILQANRSGLLVGPLLAFAAVLGFALLQLPALVAVLAVYELYRREPVQLTLEGRRVTQGSRTFLLGQPGETIEHRPPGTLTLSNDESDPLVLHGRASTLDGLTSVFREVSASAEPSGQSEDVPAALRVLKTREPAR